MASLNFSLPNDLLSQLRGIERKTPGAKLSPLICDFVRKGIEVWEKENTVRGTTIKDDTKNE